MKNYDATGRRNVCADCKGGPGSLVQIIAGDCCKPDCPSARDIITGKGWPECPF